MAYTLSCSRDLDLITSYIYSNKWRLLETVVWWIDNSYHKARKDKLLSTVLFMKSRAYVIYKGAGSKGLRHPSTWCLSTALPLLTLYASSIAPSGGRGKGLLEKVYWLLDGHKKYSGSLFLPFGCFGVVALFIGVGSTDSQPLSWWCAARSNSRFF